MSAARRARLEARAIAELRPVERDIDWGALDRIAAYAAERRAELGEEAWAKAQAMWQ